MIFRMKTIVALLLMSVSAWADEGDLVITCNYKYLGFPTSSVTVVAYPDGSLSSSALVDMQGRTHKETLTAESVGSGEFLHAWLSKESADNSIELIIYSTPHVEGQSKLINHHAPMNQEMWGDCTGVPAS